MQTKSSLQLVIVVFITGLIGIVIYFRNDLFPNKTPVETSINNEITEKIQVKKNEEISVDRLQNIEEEIETLQQKFKNQEVQLTELKKKQTAQSTPEAATTSGGVIGTAQTKGSSFSTSSTGYTPMNMFINITCPKACTLWINFYTISKNNSANNVNTYGVFINGQDKDIYSQTSLHAANSAQSVSLNTTQDVEAGTYTVEIQTKTSGGTLQSDISYLQVMAIEE